MRSKTDENAFETHIKESLLNHNFTEGENKNFNKDFAIDEKIFWEFLQNTQEKELKKLEKNLQYKEIILQRLDRVIKRDGVIKVLKKGLNIEDAHFKFFFVSPLASSGEEIRKKFDSNVFSFTRQVTFSKSDPKLRLDMVLFLNGLPLITMELKNPWMGQNAIVHGIKQYKEDRDPKEPLLNFGRCLVHFAVDFDEIYMTTKLEKNNTKFLPFNKGNNFGAGNPPNPNGHKTAYLWEEIFSKKSLANIIQHFVRRDKDKLLFPRYHQLDVVRSLINDVSKNGVGRTYLIQHSAGSGKSNSITWCAYQLIEVYPNSQNIQGSKGLDYPLFDSVIIVTDRKILDQQLRDNVISFGEQKNIIAPAQSSKELKKHLENGKKIILTTIHKFSYIVDGISDLSDKRFAVIIDEAHSSQSGTSHTNMNETIGKKDFSDDFDAQDKILEAIKSRKLQSNASYLAFTATPKNTTLEKFGVKQDDGSFKPFHLYSMKQAIEEGFILDVLANYTTYRSYYEITKSIEDNPKFNEQKAQKKLKSFVEKNPSTIATKVEIILNHFMEKIVNTKKLKGNAKGMIVTANIETAIIYFNALNEELKKLGKPFKAIIAFSGEKEVGKIKHTEESINNFSSKDISEKFDSDDYKLLVVANKFLTGFDQKKLCAMYVDKKLQGVLAVQALSRLNRSAPEYGKKTEDLFILDFYNTVDDIKDAFDPFYTSTTLNKATDISVLDDLKEKLDEVGVYETSEIDEFFDKFFSGVEASQLSPIIDKSAQRFNTELNLTDAKKADYKIKAKQFVKIYSQISSIISYEVLSWEKLYWFLKFLISKLIIKNKEIDILDELLDSVDLSTYGLERTKTSVSIKLDETETRLEPINNNPRGAYGNSQKEKLDQIIYDFNQRWFSHWNKKTEECKEIALHITQKLVKHKDFEDQYKNNNDKDTKELAFDNMMRNIINQNRRNDLSFYKSYIEEANFRKDFNNIIKILSSNTNMNF